MTRPDVLIPMSELQRTRGSTNRDRLLFASVRARFQGRLQHRDVRIGQESESSLLQTQSHRGTDAVAFSQLLEQKKEEISKFSQKAGKDAWESSSKAASPYLEKMPDVKQLVDDNLSKVSGYVGEDRVKVRPLSACSQRTDPDECVAALDRQGGLL